MESQRKIFNYDNLNESKFIKLTNKRDLFPNAISAAGCLFYKGVNGKKQFLTQL